MNVLIEIASGGAVKYELDKEFGVLRVDRFLAGANHYPANYGFIPGTLSDDGDPCDILVVCTPPLAPGALIACRPVGALLMRDEAGSDEKILAVPVDKVQPATAHIRDVTDLPPGMADQIADFFATYKNLEKGKWVKTEGVVGRAEAERLIMDGVRRLEAKAAA